MKCTGLHCPMQHGYDVENCKLTDCKYRTTPMTNYDRIRNMSVEEMAEFIANDRKRIIEPIVEMFKIFRLDKICDIAKENIKEWLGKEAEE